MSIKHLLARRRPSPALIVACCALFVALGGTSYAVAVGSVGSREIRNHSIGGVDLRADGVGGGAIKEESLDASKLTAASAGIAGTAGGLALQVRVDLTGAESRARGVEDVNHLHTGEYQVIFDHDVSGCVPAATIFDDLTGPGEISVRTNEGEPTALYVHTTDSAGAAADQTFYLLVSC